MRLILGLLLAALPAVAADSPAALRDLTAGQYELKLSGLLCWACARAVAVELSRVPGVERASADFDRQAIEVSVKSDKTVPAAQVRKALRRAERLANLGGHYEVVSLAYKIVPLLPDQAKSKARR